MEWVFDNKGNLVCGDYALTTVNNAFNNKQSFWISKKGYTISFYCFTFIDQKDYKENTSDPSVWINYFEDRISKLENTDRRVV